MAEISGMAASTSIRSVGNNIARGGGAFSSVMVGLGPINFRFGKGQKLLNFWDNLEGITTNSLGIANTISGGSIEFDEKSLSFNYKDGFMKKFINNVLGADAFVPHSNMFNASNSLIAHEGHHIWQSKYFDHLFTSTYLMNTLREKIVNSNYSWFRAYRNNFFELQGYDKIWYR